MKRTVIKIGVVFVAAAILLMILYIGIFDAQKAIRHIPVEIDLATMANAASGLSETLGDSKDIIYQNGSNQALIIVNTSKAAGDLVETYAEYIKSGQYRYERLQSTPESELLLQKWNYTPIYKRAMSALGLQRKDLGNPFAAIYGEEKAKSMPNHPYYIRIIIESNQIRYVIDAFCNKPSFLNQIITEVVNQY